jgi:HIRAN domain
MPWDGDVFEIWTEVAGVTFANNDGSSRQEIIRKYCREGSDLGFAPEPNNRFDRHAISVWVPGRKKWFRRRPLLQVGYVPREHLQEMHDWRLKGGDVAGTVWKVVGGGRGKTLGLRINIRLLPLSAK